MTEPPPVVEPLKQRKPLAPSIGQPQTLGLSPPVCKAWVEVDPSTVAVHELCPVPWHDALFRLEQPVRQ